VSILRRAFEIFVASPAPLSARDLEVRLPMHVANPRRITAALRSRGLIEPVVSVGQAHERYFAMVPGALPPVDKRAEHVGRINKARAIKRERAARLAKGSSK
jgi:hypothetical protein